jgi:putative endonuclease
MNGPARSRKNLGDSAERVAALYLEERGCKIIARNVRTRAGEIDLIAQDAEGLAFIEVKARRGTAYGAPEEAITPRKQIRLVNLAEAFMARQPEFAARPWRIDVVAIQLDRAGTVVRINHIKNAVQL